MRVICRFFTGLKSLVIYFLFGSIHAGLNPVQSQDLTVLDRLSNSISALRGDLESLWPDDLKMEGLSVRVGLATGVVPDYLGSDNYRLRLLPILDLRYERRLRLFNNKLSYAVIKKGDFEAGPQLTLAFGRQENANKALTGLGNVDTVLMAGAYARLRSKAYQAGIDFRHALWDNQGWWVEAYGHHGLFKDGPFILAAGAKAKFFSKDAARTRFGINATQAANSEAQYDAFLPGSGLDEVTGQLLGIWEMGEKSRFISLVSVGRLMGEADNSPLVRQMGSATQIVAGIGLFFHF